MIKRQPWVDLESAFDLKQKQPGIVRVTPSASSTWKTMRVKS
jgi:hypothetical protein